MMYLEELVSRLEVKALISMPGQLRDLVYMQVHNLKMELT